MRHSHVDVAATFGDNLIRCRRGADLSQDEVAFRASIHRTEVSQLERGLRIPRIDTLAKLCGALEVEFDELMKGLNWQSGSQVRGSFRASENVGG